MPFANTLVKAISIPKNTPPIQDKISPIVGVVNKAVKLNPLPHKMNAPNTQTKEAIIEEIDGFSLVKMKMVIGTAIQEKLSKKVFLAGVVESSPINWNRYAAPKIRPAGIQIQYDLFKSFKSPFNKMMKYMARQDKAPLTPTSKAGE